MVVLGKNGKHHGSLPGGERHLLNEFLKKHRNVEQLQATVVKQDAVAAQQQKQIEAIS